MSGPPASINFVICHDRRDAIASVSAAFLRLRSLLFVPGDRPDQMQKALLAGADALILDLEDSVAFEAKSAARRHVADFLNADTSRSLPIFVRTNSVASGLLEEDTQLAAARPFGWVLPKAEGAASVNALAERLESFGIVAPLILPIVTETPTAVFKLAEYTNVAHRLAGVTWGAEDLRAALGAATSRDADGSFTSPYAVARALVLFAARAAGVLAIETIYPAFRDMDGLTRFATLAARDGFDGMMAIHPSHIPIIHEAFKPSAGAVEHARRVLAAFANHPGSGVLTLDGMMIDAPHLRQARHILAQLGES